MSEQAISQELTRVRKLKRALEAEVELLRSDMEQGKIHLRVSQDKAFRQRLAECMVKMSAPGYLKGFHGWYEADVPKGEVYHCQNGSYPSYSEENQLIVDVEDCFNEDCSYSAEVDWKLVDMPFWTDLVDEYLADQDETRNENGDIPEWVDESEVRAWGFENSSFAGDLEAIENEWYEEALSFALGEIKDEIIIEL